MAARPLRHVVNVWAALFLLAVFGAARSCAVEDYVTRQSNGFEIGARSLWGTIYIQWQPVAVPREQAWEYRRVNAARCGAPVIPSDRQLGFLGFNWYKAGPNSYWPGMTFVSIPWWFLIVVPLIAPTVQLYRYLRDIQRTNTGLCGGCGYDLRSTRDNCPECGRPVRFYLTS